MVKEIQNASRTKILRKSTTPVAILQIPQALATHLLRNMTIYCSNWLISNLRTQRNIQVSETPAKERSSSEVPY